MNQTAEKNRTRYTLLCDRRRAIFELHKLLDAVRTHPRWPDAATRYPGLEGLVTEPLTSPAFTLCARASQADSDALGRDVRTLYRSLSLLSKVWVGLEDGSDLEPLVAAHYGDLF